MGSADPSIVCLMKSASAVAGMRCRSAAECEFFKFFEPRPALPPLNRLKANGVFTIRPNLRSE